jgi:hypothetical protein
MAMRLLSGLQAMADLKEWKLSCFSPLPPWITERVTFSLLMFRMKIASQDSRSLKKATSSPLGEMEGCRLKKLWSRP